jgi:Alkaline phosphatase
LTSHGRRRGAIYSRHKRRRETRHARSVAELRGNGFDIVRTRTDLEAVPAWRRSKLFGLFSNNDLAFANQVEERGQQPSLSDMVRRAIQLLQYNAGGYLLVVDAGLMRKAAEENNGERTLSQTLELDRAVGVARSYGGPKSTIIVCGDAAIGGMSLNGFPFGKTVESRYWDSIQLVTMDYVGNGAARNEVIRRGETTGEPGPGRNQRTYTGTARAGGDLHKIGAGHVEDVVAFGSGPGTDALQGVIESTDVFKILRDEL